MENKRLLVVGQINIDTLIGDSFGTIVTPGGGGTYVAIAASTYPAVETSLLATICPDMPGTFLEDLRRCNVNTDNILPLLGCQRRSRLEYSSDFLRNNTGMLTSPWQFATNEQTPRHLPLRNVAYHALHLPPQPSYNQHLYAEWGRRSGFLVSLDTCERYAESDSAALMDTLRFVDIFMPSEIELYQMFPEADKDPDRIAAAVHSLGVKLLVMKCADKGSILYDFDARMVYHVGIRNVCAVDATGAGDSYNGGFLACYLGTGDVALSARYGACVASECVRAIGYSGICGKREADIMPLIPSVPCVKSRMADKVLSGD